MLMCWDGDIVPLQARLTLFQLVFFSALDLYALNVFLPFTMLSSFLEQFGSLNLNNWHLSFDK